MERRHSTSEQFPPLSFEKSRSREWDCYTDEQRASVVYHWLRDGMTTRQMDIQLLGQNPDGSSKGWQSKGIYSYLGLNKEHQGFFKGWTISEIVGYFHSQHSYELGTIFNYFYSYLMLHDGSDAIQQPNDKEAVSQGWIADVWMPERREKDSIDEHLLALPETNGKRGRIALKDREIYYSSATIKETVKDIYDFRCQICGDVILKRGWAKGLSRIESWRYLSSDIHHILPLSKGGPDSRDNMICLCPTCHRKFHSGEFRLISKNSGFLLSDEMLGTKSQIIQKHEIHLY